MRIRIDGLDKLADDLQAKAREADRNMHRALQEIAAIAQNQAESGIAGPPATGVVYGNHRASAPGEYPARDTGGLKVRAEALPHGAALVATPGEQARALERGTRNMEPRPFMRRSLEETKDEAEARIRRAIDRTLD